nr:hypothetical protein [Tanacetum cinerariifolium]
ETDSRDLPRGRSRALILNTLRDDRPKDMERFCSARESYGDSFSLLLSRRRPFSPYEEEKGQQIPTIQRVKKRFKRREVPEVKVKKTQIYGRGRLNETVDV